MAESPVMSGRAPWRCSGWDGKERKGNAENGNFPSVILGQRDPKRKGEKRKWLKSLLSLFQLHEGGCPGGLHRKWEEKKGIRGTSLVVQWLRLYTSTVRSAGSILGQGTKILHAAWPGKKEKN